MWLKNWTFFCTFCVVFCSCLVSSIAVDFESRQVHSSNSNPSPSSFDNGFDCSNKTHRWHSQNNACLIDRIEAVPIAEEQPLTDHRATGRFIGGLGLRIRDATCAANQTRCWVVNCCNPGETCGAINVGCTASYSTIYTTTTVSSWSTILDVVTPTSGVSTTVVTATSTTYLTSYKPVTLPGAGQNTVVETTTSTTTTLILSAYTPVPVTVTRSVSADPESTAAPKQKKDIRNRVLPRADIPSSSDDIKYTTVTVFVTNFYTAFATSTLTGSLVTLENTVTISSIATRNQTFYRTPTAFTTITETVTLTSSSYAFGQLASATQTVTTTQRLPSSVLAGTQPTNASDPSQSDPSGAYPPSGSHKLSPGAIAGLVVGILLALILLVLLIVFLCCIRRKKNRRAGYDREVRHSRHLVDVPNPPSPPTPQMAMVGSSPSPPFARNSNSNSSSDDSPSPPLPVAAAAGRHGHSNGNGSNLRYGYGRKSSRSSVVSITPVPEEDEEEEEADPRSHSRTAGLRRNSGDSARSWGRGYGGRGGYNGRNIDPRSRATEPSSPTNQAFRGAITSTYSDESLVPPHARGRHE